MLKEAVLFGCGVVIGAVGGFFGGQLFLKKEVEKVKAENEQLNAKVKALQKKVDAKLDKQMKKADRELDKVNTSKELRELARNYAMHKDDEEDYPPDDIPCPEPYLITKDDYMTRWAHAHNETLSYYKKNEILANDRDEKIDIPMFNERIMTYLSKLTGTDSVYVRDDSVDTLYDIKIEYEIDWDEEHSAD